jgi:predicted hydrocarbon binding protein
VKPRPPSEPVGLTIAGSLIVAVIGGLITVFPSITSLTEIIVATIVVLVLVVPAVLYLVRRIRRMLRRPDHVEELTGYTFNRETGILLKGKIENVALRVSTIHRLVGDLVENLAPERRSEVLFAAGHETGREWASEFRHTVATVGVDRSDLAMQLLRWSEYDASAGMGRLSVAMTPWHKEGMVSVWNSFLSRYSTTTTLDHWFAGYIAGTLQELMGRRFAVELVEPDRGNAREIALFHVREVD